MNALASISRNPRPWVYAIAGAFIAANAVALYMEFFWLALAPIVIMLVATALLRLDRLLLFIEDVALGVGYRALDRAFKARLGHGPKNSILAFRLNGVRADLLSSDPDLPIADLALRWGFWHMGDFARTYRAEFGELPSETRFTAR